MVDEELKQEILKREAKASQEIKEAKEYINLENLAGLTNKEMVPCLNQSTKTQTG